MNIFKALLRKALTVTKKSEKLYHGPCFFYEIGYNFANKTLAWKFNKARVFLWKIGWYGSPMILW